MKKRTICCAGSTVAATYAYTYLSSWGLPVTNTPGEQTRHLLLDVPSFGPNGLLRGGTDISSLLPTGHRCTVYGGNLNHPALDNYRTVDFLSDPIYLAENAYITAECALDVALPYLGITLRKCPVLIIGWGRIGKCLGLLLQKIGADVTIAARKNTDRAMIHALGFHASDTGTIAGELAHFRLIYNTVPAPVISAAQNEICHPDCVRIDLASKRGIDGDDVIIARGLPGIHMPESSGKLIAETFIRLFDKEDK